MLDLTAGHEVHPEAEITERDIALASRHGLVGIMATNDDPLLAGPARVPFARLQARQRVMESVLHSLLSDLEQANLAATVIKGPALAAWAYQDVRHRTYTDLDLLVPPHQVERTLEVIRDHPATVAVPPKAPRAAKRNIALSHRSGIRFTLDLHWDLFSYSQLRGCAQGATKDAWERAHWQPDHALGPMWVLPDEVLITFLATHAILDHRFRLILFRDLAEIAAAGIEWEEVVDFAHRHGLRSLSYAAWYIASGAAAAQVPATVLRALRKGSLALRAMEWLIPRTDLAHFDGHRPHPLNLAIVLQHDYLATRAHLVLAAPGALPHWLDRIGGLRGVIRVALAERRLPSRPRPRVLHLLPADLARGAQTYAKAMRDTLDSPEAEHRTTIIFRSEPVALFADVELGVSTGVLRRIGFSPMAVARLRRHIRHWRPDIVVAHGGESLKYAVMAAPLSTRLIYYKIGTSLELLHNPLRRLLHRLLVSRADLVAGVSREMVTEARTLLGAAASRTAYIPNGRDPDAFPYLANPGERRGPPQFVFVGYLTKNKRPDRFIDIIATLQARGVAATGVVIGDGPLANKLKASAPPQVVFLGRRDDVPSLLAEGDVLLFTSDSGGEGMPGVLIEAGLAGLPVVTTDVPGARTVVEDGVTGFVVGAKDGRAFAEAAERLARDPALRAAMGAAARARCLDRFTLEASTEMWRRRLTSLLADPGR